MLVGKISNRRRKFKLLKEAVDKKIDRVIFQIPTVGNVQSVNKIFETVKGYSLPMPVETWVVIEDWDTHKDEYVCDRVVMVPKRF